MRYLFCFLISFISILACAQETATLFGKITDASNLEPIDIGIVSVLSESLITESGEDGFYKLTVPANKVLLVDVSRIGYGTIQYELSPIPVNGKRLINFSLDSDIGDLEVVVKSQRIVDGGLIEAQIDELKFLPSVSGNLESLLPSIALGTFGGTGGELTSQYNVRGGNYDENLVYVNDFEIYRPQLISNSQQEGLSFPNIDLIKSLSFSSGGFKASLGDKMSSSLNINYKRPDDWAGSVQASLLGGSAHLEGSLQVGKTKRRKLRFLVGTRYKTTRYLLNSLEVTGQYDPNFSDIQAYITYDFHDNWQLGVLSNYNNAVYRFKPESRSTAVGLINLAIRLSSNFEGAERDEFKTNMNGVSLTHVSSKSKHPTFLKFLASSQISDEKERFDIIGSYRLSQIDIGLGSDTQGDEIAVLGRGTQHTFTRNFLKSQIYNVEHKGGIEFNKAANSKGISKSNFLEWGIKLQQEFIDDRINEWERLDSAGFSIPYDPSQLRIQSVYKTENSLSSNRYSAFVQNTFSRINQDKNEYHLTIGARVTHWDLNGETNISPRAQLKINPLNWKRNMSFRISSGLYVQPPFYREMRKIDGTLNTDLLAQKSFHVVGGMTYDFKWPAISKKDFRLIVETYYKKLWDIASYDVDNVKIRYSGENDAEGYVTGIDMRINGEFVPGAESWINLSYLRARERLEGVQHRKFDANAQETVDVDYVPRPSNQTMTLSMFFQDYLPKNDRFKVHMGLVVGTGLPFGIKDNNVEFRNTFKYPAYHRIDLGFSFQLFDQSMRTSHPNNFFRFTKKSWISLEVFNLLQVSNEASKTWVKTITNEQFAIANNLTSRRINLRFRMDF